MFDIQLFLQISIHTSFSGILPIVLSSNAFAPYNLIRLPRSPQIHSLKTVPSNLGLANNVQVNNKSQIVLLAENSTESNDSFALKEQYELQNETGFYTFNL